MQNNPEENIDLKRTQYDGRRVEYSIEVEDKTLSPKLLEVIKKIAELEKQKMSLMVEISKNFTLPSGWQFDIGSANQYSGKVNVLCHRMVNIPEPLQQKPRSAMSRLAEYVDTKTLFNCGILTNAEKRTLLNVEEIIKEVAENNAKKAAKNENS